KIVNKMFGLRLANTSSFRGKSLKQTSPAPSFFQAKPPNSFARLFSEKKQPLTENDVLRIRLNALVRNRSYAQALQICDEEINKSPDNYLPFGIKGYILTKLGKPEASLPIFKTSIQLNPNEKLTYQNKG